MSLNQELDALRHSQHSMDENYRIHSNGSVSEQVLTARGQTGWRLIAKPIHGVGPKLAAYFEDGYLAVDDLRRALDIRDAILTATVEEKTVRSMEKVVRKQIRDEKPKKPRPKKTRLASSTRMF